jgi:hypothetical protein
MEALFSEASNDSVYNEESEEYTIKREDPVDPGQGVVSRHSCPDVAVAEHGLIGEARDELFGFSTPQSAAKQSVGRTLEAGLSAWIPSFLRKEKGVGRKASKPYLTRHHPELRAIPLGGRREGLGKGGHRGSWIKGLEASEEALISNTLSNNYRKFKISFRLLNLIS